MIEKIDSVEEVTDEFPATASRVRLSLSADQTFIASDAGISVGHPHTRTIALDSSCLTERWGRIDSEASPATKFQALSRALHKSEISPEDPATLLIEDITSDGEIGPENDILKSEVVVGEAEFRYRFGEDSNTPIARLVFIDSDVVRDQPGE